MTPRELEGEPFDCPKCHWIHRPSQACPKSKPPTKPLGRTGAEHRGPERSAAELTAGFRDWEERAKAQPTTYEPTDRTCPGCYDRIFIATNFLGTVWEVIGADWEPWDEHQTHCRVLVAPKLPDLQRPRRAGLPYKDGDDE